MGTGCGQARGDAGRLLSLRPHPAAGQAVGLLGGSFDPAHEGHVRITREALRRFGLARVVWLVSPGNPLKPQGPAPLAERMEKALALMDHPRVGISDFEARAGSPYTAATIATLRARYPGVHFVWLMGADNLAQIPLWHNWRQIVESVPLGVLARPGTRVAALLSPAARIYSQARVPAAASHLLGHAEPPAWCFVNLPMSPLSSSAIRAGRADNDA